MICFTRKFIVLSLFLLTFFVFSSETKSQDKTTVDQQIRFQSGKNNTVIRKQIRKRNSHQYRLRAREGQNMTVILKTGKRTSFTVFSPTEGIIEGADGETMWRGMLNENGEYLIVIGTDATANYTLEIWIR